MLITVTSIGFSVMYLCMCIGCHIKSQLQTWLSVSVPVLLAVHFSYHSVPLVLFVQEVCNSWTFHSIKSTKSNDLETVSSSCVLWMAQVTFSTSGCMGSRCWKDKLKPISTFRGFVLKMKEPSTAVWKLPSKVCSLQHLSWAWVSLLRAVAHQRCFTGASVSPSVSLAVQKFSFMCVWHVVWEAHQWWRDSVASAQTQINFWRKNSRRIFKMKQ